MAVKDDQEHQRQAGNSQPSIDTITPGHIVVAQFAVFDFGAAHQMVSSFDTF
jgi:hypothetical protein